MRDNLREDERAKKLQPFLQYLNQTPAAELLNDYTYQLIYIGRDSEEQLERLQYLQDKVTEQGSGELRAAVTKEIGCSQRTYERAYHSLVESGEIEKFQLNQKGGLRGWFSRLTRQSEIDGEVIE